MSLEFASSFKWAWKLVSWLPGFFFKKVFSEDWFKKQIIIDLRARHSPIELWAGDKKDIRIWLSITNITYFDIELDRLMIEFNCSGHEVRLNLFERNKIKSMSFQDNIFLKSNLTPDHVVAIERNLESAKSGYVNLVAEFNSKVHNFRITKTLDGVTPRFYNFSAK